MFARRCEVNLAKKLATAHSREGTQINTRIKRAGIIRVHVPPFAAHLFFLLPISAAPTFHSDIAPIVHQYCSPCHRPGEAGPFPLLTYADVKSHAKQIADVT